MPLKIIDHLSNVRRKFSRSLPYPDLDEIAEFRRERDPQINMDTAPQMMNSLTCTASGVWNFIVVNKWIVWPMAFENWVGKRKLGRIYRIETRSLGSTD